MKKLLIGLILIFAANICLAKNVALVIGMDHGCYSCEADARVMQTTLKNQNFEVKLMIDPKAKSVVNFIDKKSRELQANDMFVLYYSGHGYHTRDRSGDEIDGQDEYWVLRRSNLLDDTIRSYLSQFTFGVRILLLSDSCHSGTMYKLNENKGFYERDREAEDFKADLIAITSSQDNETSLMGSPYSQFTDSIINVWNDGAFEGNYYEFYQELYNINLNRSGRHVQYHAEGFTVDRFEGMIPFTN